MLAHGVAPNVYRASLLAGVLVAGCIVAVVAGLDSTASGSAAALALRVAAVSATVVSSLALLASVIGLFRGEATASGSALVVSALVFVLALAVAFSIFAGNSNPYPLISFPT